MEKKLDDKTQKAIDDIMKIIKDNNLELGINTTHTVVIAPKVENK